MPKTLVVRNTVFKADITGKTGFVTINVDYFKTLINFIKQFVEEVNIKIRKDGIEILAMDSSHISLVNIFLPCNYFNKYNCIEPEIFGVNLTLFSKIINTGNINDELKIIFDSDYIEFTFYNKSYTKIYNLKLIEIDEEELNITEPEDTTKIQLSSKMFHNFIKDFNDVGEIMNIKIKDGSIFMESKGEMTGLNLELMKPYTASNLKDIETSYDCKYIHMFSKGYNITPEVELTLHSEYPLKLSYEFMNGAYINYHIAPKIGDDDDY